MTLSDYAVEIFNNGSPTATNTLALTGILANGSVLAICNPSASTALKGQCNLIPTTAVVLSFDGNDGLQLVRISTSALVDRIGDDSNPTTAWTNGSVSTKDQTLRRKCSVKQGDTDYSAPFDPAAEWDALPVDTFGDVGTYSCP